MAMQASGRDNGERNGSTEDGVKKKRRGRKSGTIRERPRVFESTRKNFVSKGGGSWTRFFGRWEKQLFPFSFSPLPFPATHLPFRPPLRSLTPQGPLHGPWEPNLFFSSFFLWLVRPRATVSPSAAQERKEGRGPSIDWSTSERSR